MKKRKRGGGDVDADGWIRRNGRGEVVYTDHCNYGLVD